MATHSFVEIELPEATDLAAYTGIEFDLRSAREFATMLQEEHAGRPWHRSLADPLTTAMLIRYMRPFEGGLGARLAQKALSALTPEQLRKHRFFDAVRDKHIAHSVNEFEDSQPIARFCVERVREEGITSVECNHTRVIGLGFEDIQGVIELATVMLRFIEEQLAVEKAKILEIVRRKPLDDVLAGPADRRPPGMSDPIKRRKR